MSSNEWQLRSRFCSVLCICHASSGCHNIHNWLQRRRDPPFPVDIDEDDPRLVEAIELDPGVADLIIDQDASSMRLRVSAYCNRFWKVTADNRLRQK